ncbi:MAG TPA: division/cell wall cluster transcriptional repressor MraZ [Candidatus Copromorpha excrementigallinarum]|uniref:Transcriptional regulator MraZ n=1 Tax=Candidatus Allocopromorpha excrementigallinarum TaxID=2840742 RepID=A0A9D1I0J5_9FIRM|nr:division/cell wall cluster transcriptional repressor MraZ [Candidatus Copromorpha excrementigallinarum]
MFVGKFNNSIDSKSRMIVPAKFREGLGGKCIIAKALDKCLTIYPVDEWEKFAEEKLEILPAGNPQARKLKRHFYSSAAECDVDKQGRLTLPQELKEYAGIEKDLITVGSNKTIEIWSREYWTDEIDPETEEVMNASEVAESMEQYGF